MSGTKVNEESETACPNFSCWLLVVGGEQNVVLILTYYFFKSVKPCCWNKEARCCYEEGFCFIFVVRK